MMLFTATEPLVIVEIYILGEIIGEKHGNRLLLVVTDLFTKRTKKIRLKLITATTVSYAFVQNWVFWYDPPKKVLSGQFFGHYSIYSHID